MGVAGNGAVGRRGAVGEVKFMRLTCIIEDDDEKRSSTFETKKESPPPRENPGYPHADAHFRSNFSTKLTQPIFSILDLHIQLTDHRS